MKKEVKERIRLAEECKSRIRNTCREMELLYQNGNLSYEEYFFRLSQFLKGKSENQWYGYYDSYIKECKKKSQALPSVEFLRETSKGRYITISIIIAFIIALSFGLNYTGFTILESGNATDSTTTTAPETTTTLLENTTTLLEETTTNTTTNSTTTTLPSNTTTTTLLEETTTNTTTNSTTTTLPSNTTTTTESTTTTLPETSTTIPPITNQTTTTTLPTTTTTLLSNLTKTQNETAQSTNLTENQTYTIPENAFSQETITAQGDPTNPNRMNSSSTLPMTLNVQGLLKDSTGSAVTDGNYVFTFNLYNVSSGGTSLYTENRTLSTSAGVYDATIGPLNFSFEDPPYYLGLEVDGDGEMSPRINFTSMPYSFRARNFSFIDLDFSGTTGFSDLVDNAGNTSEDILDATDGVYINVTGDAQTRSGNLTINTLTLGGTAEAKGYDISNVGTLWANMLKGALHCGNITGNISDLCTIADTLKGNTTEEIRDATDTIYINISGDAQNRSGNLTAGFIIPSKDNAYDLGNETHTYSWIFSQNLKGSLDCGNISGATSDLCTITAGANTTDEITAATDGIYINITGDAQTRTSGNLSIMGNVSIGTAIPESILHLSIPIGTVLLEGENAGETNPIFSIVWRNTDVTTDYTAAKIESFNTGGTDDGDLRFFTTQGGTNTEKMRIDEDGNVNITGTLEATMLKGSLDCGNLTGNSSDLCTIIDGANTTDDITAATDGIYINISGDDQTRTGNLDIIGNTSISGNLSVGDIFLVDNTTGDVNISGNLIFGTNQKSIQMVTTEGTIVTRVFELDTGENLNIARDDTITTIQLFGQTIIYDDAASPSGIVTIRSTGYTIIANNLSIQQNITFANNVSLDTKLSNQLSIMGTKDTGGVVNITSTTGDMNLSGDLDIRGNISLATGQSSVGKTSVDIASGHINMTRGDINLTNTLWLSNISASIIGEPSNGLRNITVDASTGGGSLIILLG